MTDRTPLSGDRVLPPPGKPRSYDYYVAWTNPISGTLYYRCRGPVRGEDVNLTDCEWTAAGWKVKVGRIRERVLTDLTAISKVDV